MGIHLEIIDAMSTDLHQAAKQTTNRPTSLYKTRISFLVILLEMSGLQSYTRRRLAKIYKDPNIKKYMRDMISIK